MRDGHQSQSQDAPAVIEEARPEDAERIIYVNIQSWLTTYPNADLDISYQEISDFIGGGVPEKVTLWREFLGKCQGSSFARVWVARAAAEGVVGFCLARKNASENTVQMLYLLKAWQGFGLGKKLMEQADAWFDRSKPVRIKVVAYNQPAIGFYTRRGFKKIDDVPTAEAFTLASGKVLPEIQMEKTFA